MTVRYYKVCCYVPDCDDPQPVGLGVSVVTPTLNAAVFLTGCLESIRYQACATVEHIVVDGGSTDSTVALARAAGDIVYVECRGSNHVRAINEGFRAANGQILAWLNADDEYTPGTLRIVQDRFEADPALDVMYGDCDVYDLGTRLLWREVPGPYDFHRLLRRGNYLAQPAVFMRRRVLDRVGYLDESFEYGMDYEFWLRLRSCRVQYVPGVLAIFRWHAGSKTALNQFGSWRDVVRASQRHGGGWTPALAWSFSRMLFTVGRQRIGRALPLGGDPVQPLWRGHDVR
jgi:glycosyltransferase involved in cell wall biosynthesis